MFVAWVAGSVASLIGLIFCRSFDYSAGVSVALFLGIILIVSGMWKLLAEKRKNHWGLLDNGSLDGRIKRR